MKTFRVSFDKRNDMLVVTNSDSYDRVRELASEGGRAITGIKPSTEEVVIDPEITSSGKGLDAAIRQFEEGRS